MKKEGGCGEGKRNKGKKYDTGTRRRSQLHSVSLALNHTA
jgi:hypothetical protein